jgi:RimJ/RimL family protein N-acetyltransferase
MERERLRYEWTPEAGVEPPTGRLVFSAESSDDVFLDAFRRVAVGSLDSDTREGVARLGVDGQARETLQTHRSMRGRREWWRMAYTPDGHVAGFTIPSANEDFPVIGYLGVVPEMRGHGYGHDLLAEATRIHQQEGARIIRADTDVTNAPMAAAFERTRYRNFSVRLIFRS